METPVRKALDVVMRSHNDMPIVARTIEALRRQSMPFRLTVFDNASSDGTRAVLSDLAERVIHVPAGAYVPGRVLNEAMTLTESELVVFLNSDCVPQHPEWLESLVQGFKKDTTAAVFGRQIPRPDCHPLFARDTEATFGDGERQARWRHCFSMASSAIRRSAWRAVPFDETLAYSEDIDWSWRARSRGFDIGYVSEAVVEHSHNYTLKQFYRRHFGEGEAEVSIFDWSPWQRSFLRYSLLPYLRQVGEDWQYTLRQGAIAHALYALVLRTAQLSGRRAGFRKGLRSRRFCP